MVFLSVFFSAIIFSRTMEKLGKEGLKKLANLARVEIEEGEEEKLLQDAEGILRQFDELNEIETGETKPMIGGTDIVNQTENDVFSEEVFQKGTGSFPESKDGFIVVPGVMKEK